MNLIPPENRISQPSSSAYDALDDEALMGLVSAGNHTAFTEVVARHTRKSLGLAVRTLNSSADAEDVVQAVFIKVWQNPAAWQPHKSAFTTWLYRVVLNACYDLQRANTRRQGVDLDSAPEPLSTDVLHDIEQNEEDTRRRDSMHSAVRQLPANQRDALNLAVFNGLPQRQVADVLGVSLKAVESLLVRAKKTLKQSVEVDHEEC